MFSKHLVSLGLVTLGLVTLVLQACGTKKDRNDDLVRENEQLRKEKDSLVSSQEQASAEIDKGKAERKAALVRIEELKKELTKANQDQTELKGQLEALQVQKQTNDAERTRLLDDLKLKQEETALLGPDNLAVSCDG